MPKKYKKLPKWYSIARGDESKSAELHIFGDIGEFFFSTEESVTARKISEDLQKLAEKGVNNLIVRLSSFGGSIVDGISIHNAIRRFQGSASTNIETAYSIASYIGMAGDPGSISMAENGQLMVHGPRGVRFGTAQQQRDLASWLEKTADTLAPAYERDGKTQVDIKAILHGEKDEFFTAKEALDAGLIDSIEGVIPEQEIQAQIAQATARFDIPYLKTPTSTYNLAAVAAFTEPEDTEMPDKKEGVIATKDKEATMPDLNVVEIQKDAKTNTLAEIKKRNADITAAFSSFLSLDHPYHAEAQAIYNDAIADPGVTVDEVSGKLLAKLGETLSPITPEDHFVGATVVEDSRDKTKNGIVLALGSRMNGKPLDRGNEFRGQTLVQLAASSLSAVGINTTGMTKREISEQIFAVHTTADFPLLLQDSANKRLQSAYENFPSTWESIAARSETSDFKTVNLVRIGAFSTLALKPPGKQYEQGTIGEEGEQVTLRTKGRYIDFTREMLINDDLSGFERLVMMMGRASARTINQDVYSVVNTNPVMSDGIALYDAGHNNLAGTGTVISVASIGARRSAMRKQTAPGQPDEHLNVMPYVLAAPVVLEDHARTVVTSTTNTDATGALATNIIRQWSPLEVVSDPELDNTSATAWYLFANPMDVPALEVVFLAGESQPYMESEDIFLSDVLRWKVRHDVGVAANDWRGTQKNPGA